MSLSFLPGLMTEKLTDLTPEYLQSQGITLLMMDFDNTIVPYTTDVPTEEMRRWLETMNASPVKIAIVSNSKNDRLIRFCRDYHLDYIMRAHKPSPQGLVECMERFGFAPEHAAIVGDQIFTDTLAGNLAGVTPILVKAIDNHTIWLKARHVLELPFIFAARKRRIEL